MSETLERAREIVAGAALDRRDDVLRVLANHLILLYGRIAEIEERIDALEE